MASSLPASRSQGGANTASGTRDQIVLTSGTTVDFSLGTVSGIETLTGSSGNDTVTMTAAQLAGFSTINLGGGTRRAERRGERQHLGARHADDQQCRDRQPHRHIRHRYGDAQRRPAQRHLIGSGTINLGAGTGDTINLTSTSADLNTLGATNNSIQGVEAISAAGAAAGVTITLGGQTEAFAITGSAQADIITGGPAADTIDAGGGDDTINMPTASSLPASRSRAAPTPPAARATRSC